MCDLLTKIVNNSKTKGGKKETPHIQLPRNLSFIPNEYTIYWFLQFLHFFFSRSIFWHIPAQKCSQNHRMV